MTDWRFVARSPGDLVWFDSNGVPFKKTFAGNLRVSVWKLAEWVSATVGATVVPDTPTRLISKVDPAGTSLSKRTFMSVEEVVTS